MSVGIIRNKYPLLTSLKKQPIRSKSKNRFSKKRLMAKASKHVQEQPEQQTVQSSLLDTKTSETELPSMEPLWADDYRICCSVLKEAEMLRSQIKREKQRKITKLNDQQLDKVISNLFDEATSKINKCEKKLKDLQKYEQTFLHSSSTKEKSLYTNMLVAVANNVREETKLLRFQQQQQLAEQRNIDKYLQKPFQQGESTTKEKDFDEWLNEESMVSLEQRAMEERNVQIMKVVQSISALNAIYKELQSLVIEQGSLLDRIDENIQVAHQSVQDANEHLIQADKRQQSKFAKKLRLLLIVAIGICLVILAFKYT